MTAPSHLCFGLFTGLVLSSLTVAAGQSPLTWNVATALNALALFLGALAPDLDSPGSLISRLCPLARLIHRRWAHRTLCHSLLGLALSTTALYCLTLLVRASHACLFFALGYASHLVADCLTVRGVPFLFPYHMAFAYPTPERYRLRTGQRRHELIFSGVSLMAALAYLPVLQRGGAEASVHHALATVHAAYDDYRELAGQEALLDFRGYYAASREPVAGRGPILEAAPGQFLIFFHGQALAIGNDKGYIIATAARCLPAGRPVGLSAVTVVHESWTEVLGRVPADVLVSGELAANYPFTLQGPVVSSSGPVSVSGQTLKLEYAQRPELAGLHIQPQAGLEKVLAEIQALESSLVHINQALTDSISARAQQRNPYRRDEMFNVIKELRGKKDRLESQLERVRRDLQTAQEVRVFFSGQLTLRSLFVDNLP